MFGEGGLAACSRSGLRLARQLNMPYFVYIIESVAEPTRYYIGFTENLDDRLKHHNHGAVPSTKRFRPWRYRTYIAFANRDRALEFERHLKTHSGRAFLAKRF